jgi:phosphoglycerol geranylgeranyltransferase
MVGGSTAHNMAYVNKTIELIKERVDVPVIIFPGGLANVSDQADAIFFMSLLNSSSPYFIIGQQALGAYMIKNTKLEPISMGYLIIEPGATAGWIGDAKLLPRRKPELTAAYALAAEMFGFRLIYLEAGSGAQKIPTDIIRLCSRVLSIPILAGGGVQSPEDAAEFVKAGADIVVMGTFLEKNTLKDKGESLKAIIDQIKESGKSVKKEYKKICLE